MATLYLKAAGGNWTDNTAWSTVNAAGADNSGPPTAADDCIAELASGNVTVSATSVGKSFSTIAGTGSWGGTMSHNAFNWTVSGSITFNSGMTYTPLVTSTVTLNAVNTLTSAGKLFPLLALTAGVTTLADNLSFAAFKTLTLTLSGNLLDLNGKTVSANSATDRVLVRSNTLGTPRTITIGGGTFNGCDFRDITAATTLDLSAVSLFSGDCGGNTSMMFTAPTSQTYSGGNSIWSTSGLWTSRVPLPQDTALMSGVTGGTITADMPRYGSINWTGAAGSPIFAMNSIANTIYGSFTLIPAMTFTHNLASTFEGRGAYTLTNAGKSFGASCIMQMISGSLTCLDAMTIPGNFSWTVTNGTFNDSGFNCAFGRLSSNNSNARSITLSAVTTLTRNLGDMMLDFGLSTNLTFTHTGTIIIPALSANNSFAGGSMTFKDLLIAGSGAGSVQLTGSANTFNRIYSDNSGIKTIILPGSSTTIIASGLGLNNGTNVITFTASTLSATISKSSGGVVAWDYVNLTNIPATQTSTWYAGTHSTDGGGNTNWVFTDPPISPTLPGYRFGTTNFLLLGVG